MTTRLLLAALTAGTALAGATLASTSTAEAVEIEYWQYIFDSRVQAMDQLIAAFQQANPDITVKQVTFPYADYQTRVTAATMARKGPDVMQLYYGWADKFIDGKVVQPLPEDMFPAATIDAEFFPFVQVMKRDGVYYGIPTAVRSLGLFYNKKLFADAGIDAPPATLDELVADGKKLAQKDSGGNFTTVGITMDMGGQDHHWWREVLLRQFGAAPYDDNTTKVTYDSEGGAAALDWYAGLHSKEQISTPGFMDEGQAAFRAGRAAMTVDGTFRLGAFNKITDFEWGVTELPAGPDGTKSNFASFFANAIGAGAEGEELEASKKFLAYISSPEAMEIWMKTVGELPARRDVALTEANLADPVYGPFIRGLDYAKTTIFKDEMAQRQVAMDMVNRMELQGQSAADSLAEAAKAEQEILDRAN
ncbi:extracellular solute-binding protein [Paracoccus sp. CPCC 101403]|uniref:Extracellular solute-binding protein n=1 Tax=Paracoccus broussonetiae TaxID=3075834 RepID=A0ABU3EDR6_9RHOB|nr:extracellular solute-binding protein [Paracoccus sp. CPCC 101403]MDT1062383.1 extracellular solute-binding protein [Paracoccus sp. CPCC 101403]